jgi:hypothetical protein
MKTKLDIDIRVPGDAVRKNLRCGRSAYVWGCPDAATPTARFGILGIDDEGFFHSWMADGRWLADGTDHDMDIVFAHPA